MIDDPLLIERLRLAAILADALNSIALAQVAFDASPPDDPRRPQLQKLVLAGFDLAHAAGDRLLALGAAPAVPASVN